ncbi:DUF5715 family protein [Saccharicrinis sp. FJH62]|uniref:DUF5715 family protein n=1 Tax=Saccharicrinis sp. FJH62 TaxID=3344657 RepID=UPI0035D4D424
MSFSFRNYFIFIFLSTAFIFLACNRKPKGKSIDYVSVSVLSRDELRALKKHPNADHLEAIKQSPVREVIKSHKFFEEHKDEICDQNDLQEVTDNDFYIVSVLTHSLPYLTEHTVDFLNTLGERMEASFEENGIIPYRFVLTSVLRTAEDQKKLRSFNYNATKNESAHFYGITFDISQTRFALWDSRESVYTYRLRNLLARELIRLQEEGKCYVLLENREKCFHVTVLPD